MSYWMWFWSVCLGIHFKAWIAQSIGVRHCLVWALLCSVRLFWSERPTTRCSLGKVWENGCIICELRTGINAEALTHLEGYFKLLASPDLKACVISSQLPEPLSVYSKQASSHHRRPAGSGKTNMLSHVLRLFFGRSFNGTWRAMCRKNHKLRSNNPWRNSVSFRKEKSLNMNSVHSIQFLWWITCVIVFLTCRWLWVKLNKPM